jgi:hypothetical protein
MLHDKGMDSTRPTDLTPDFNPMAAWEAARASSELYWQERRRVAEARRLAALASYDAESERPTLIPGR